MFGEISPLYLKATFTRRLDLGDAPEECFSVSPALPFVAPILQRAKDGVCQRARGRVVRLGTAVCCFQGVSCAKSVAGGMVFCDGDVSVHSRVTLSSHALHSTHTRNDSSALFRLGEAKVWRALTQLPQNSLPQCRQWCRRQYMLNAWPQLPHAGASSSRCHRSRGSGTAGRIPAAATVCAGADASSPTGGTPLLLPVPCLAHAPVPAQGHSVQAPSPKRSGCCRLNLTMWQAMLAETVPPPPQL